MAADPRLNAPAGCPDAWQLAAYAEGGLSATARSSIEQHLVNCADCRAVLHGTTVLLNDDAMNARTASLPSPTSATSRTPRGLRPAAIGLAIAATVMIAMVVARPDWLDRWREPRSDRPELQAIVAAFANEPTRPVEGRLTGGFAYAPAPAPTRGAPSRPQLSDATEDTIGQLAARFRDGQSAEALGATGVAALVTGDADRAIASLEAATRKSSVAPLYNDLASAYLARFSRAGQTDDLVRALVVADRSLALNPALLEARFNRALILERLSRRQEAHDAWQEYIRRDPSGPWSDEARRHLAAINQLARESRIGLHFRPVSLLQSEKLPSELLQMIPPVNLGQTSSDFPASFWGKSDSHNCTATLVGPWVILTAGHCLSTEREHIELEPDGTTSIGGTCDRAPKYKVVSITNDDYYLNDWALCRMDSAVPITAEVINTDPSVVGRGTDILITGFGCDLKNGMPEVGTVFRIGVMQIWETSYLGTDLILAQSLKGTTLCQGDSGGGTFAAASKDRVEVAVNSWTDNAHQSMMASLASADATTFIMHWSQCQNLEICGVDSGAAPCRSAVPAGNVKRQPVPASCPVQWQPVGTKVLSGG